MFKAFLLLSCLLATGLAWTQTFSNVTSCNCESGRNCLDGTQIQVEITDYRDTCVIVYTYKFIPNRQNPICCDLEDFVLGFFGLSFSEVTGCDDEVTTSTTSTCLSTFGSEINHPVRIVIDQSESCKSNDFQVQITVYNSSIALVPIGLKSNQDCLLCQTYGPVFNPYLGTCSRDADCNNGNPCQTYMCSSCGVCIYDTVPDCTPPTTTTPTSPSTPTTTTPTSPSTTTPTTTTPTSPSTTTPTTTTPETTTPTSPSTTTPETTTPTSPTTTTPTSPSTTTPTSPTTTPTSPSTTTPTSPTTPTTTTPETTTPTSPTTTTPETTTPTSPTTTTPETTTQTCVDVFGCASIYNVFVFGDFYGQSNSDVEGRVAAGGNLGFASDYSIGATLFPTSSFTDLEWDALCVTEYGSYDVCDFCDKCGQSVLVSGGTIQTSPDSRVYFGNWLGVDLSDLHLTNPIYPEYATINYYKAQILNGTTCPGLNNSLSQGFQSVYTQLTGISQALCNLAPSGLVNLTVSESGQVETLSVDVYCNEYEEVIFINQNDLDSLSQIQIPTATSSALTLIINVQGKTFNLGNVDLSALKSIADHVIWNFCDTETLYIGNVAVWGTILAPYANIIGGPGVINGQVFANSFNGTTQINSLTSATQFNWIPFKGCIDTSGNGESLSSCEKAIFGDNLLVEQKKVSNVNALVVSMELLIFLIGLILTF